MTNEKGYFSEAVQNAITKHLATQQKILLIVNKKGFASGQLCTSCGHIPQCHQCSVSISYHQADNGLLYGLCPICKTITDAPSSCPQCHKSDTISLYGLTIQKTAEWITTSYGTKPLTIDAQTVGSTAKSQKIREAIDTHQIIISTSTIIPPVMNKSFGLIVVLAADQSLTLPDYSVRQTTFVQLYSLITKFSTTNYIIQTHDTSHPSIRHALQLNRDGFMEEEKTFRTAHHYPPYGELCIIKYNNENETSLHNAIEKLSKELQYLQTTYEYTDLDIYTSSPLIYKKFGKFYYHIIIIGPSVRPFMDIAYSKLTMAKRGYKIDWMAESLL